MKTKRDNKVGHKVISDAVKIYRGSKWEMRCPEIERRLEAGETYTDIAASMGVNKGALTGAMQRWRKMPPSRRKATYQTPPGEEAPKPIYRSVGYQIMGDPPIGRSALDRRAERIE